MPEIDPTAPAETPEELDARQEKESRSYETLGTILLIVTVVVVVLLLWRSCSTGQQGGGESSGGAVIQSLDDLEAVEGAVSVWTAEGADIDAVLARNGLEGASATDLGEGTWVVDIGDADGPDVVKRLERDADVKDAGFLYRDAAGE